MKNILKIIISTFISILSVLLIALIIYKSINIDSYILKRLDNSNYYDLVINSEIKICEDNIYNKEYKSICKKIITKDNIIDDIKELNIGHKINNKYSDLFYNELIKMNDTNKDEIKKLVNILVKDYVNNVYPSTEINLIKTNLPSIDIFYLLVIFVVIIILSLVMIIVKSDFYLIGFLISIISLSSIIIKLIVGNIYYANDYYTLLIKSLINPLINIYLFIGLLSLSITIFLGVKKH